MYRNLKLLSLARNAAYCAMCRCANDGTIVAAHSNQLSDGKGKSLKAHDYRIAFLCRQCHYEIDQGNKLKKQEKFDLWDKAHEETMAFLLHYGFIQIDGCKPPKRLDKETIGFLFEKGYIKVIA